MDNILTVDNLCVSYRNNNNIFSGKSTEKTVLKNVSFSVGEGEIVGLCGESGSGKTTIAKAVLGMIKHKSGTIEMKDKCPQMIFQDPFGSLNPAKTVGWIIEEPLRLLTDYAADRRKEMVYEMLDSVELDANVYSRKPFELSGGQRQRVCIAASLICSPKLLIADEPVSALDVTIQKQIIELMKRLNREKKFSMLFISHDLKTMYNICDRILVLYKGEIVESGKPYDLYNSPKHPYTCKLLEGIGYKGKNC